MGLEDLLEPAASVGHQPSSDVSKSFCPVLDFEAGRFF